MKKTFRQHLLRPIFAKAQEMQGKKVIITGASPNSIGYAIAQQLLSWGATVTVTRRSKAIDLIKQLQQDTPKHVHNQIHAFDLDISNAASTLEFVKHYNYHHDSLDILINNAGIHLDLLSQWSEAKLSEDDFEIQWRTNYLGTVHLSALLLPLLLNTAKQGRQTRIVNTVSMLHTKGLNSDFFSSTPREYNSWNAYGQSKLALVHFTKELQRRYSSEGVSAYCLHPGSVYTNVAGKGLTGNPFIEKLRNSFSFLEAFFLKTPGEGAQTTLHCATSPEATGGNYYRNCKVAQASPEANDADISLQLWQQAECWVKGL